MSKFIDKDRVLEYIIFGVVGKDITCGELTRAIDSIPTIKVSEDCISIEDIDKTLNEWLEDKEMARFATKVLRLNAPRVVPTTEQSSKVGEWQITDAYPHNVYCSECHKKFAQTHWEVWEDGSLPRNYCPNCGCKMERIEEWNENT